MKCSVLLVLLGLVSLVAARPESILDLSVEDFHQDMDIDEDNTITGSYSWTSPSGEQFFVKYIADKNGFRILESNAVPVTVGGVAADGRQGASHSSEESNDSR
ncbi:cuticle protein 16.8-like [Homarus americanus]|uniref:cuticle protein 16.8-like n=1 Tax=Homarus americanus TaxID=6706 RepID=UPI001C492912|nr:cuticle protein 16.8-like [Homarus americanus]